MVPIKRDRASLRHDAEQAVQGRIKHDKLEGADPTPDFRAAAALAPERAEPLIWLCWHYHKRLDACAAADAVCRLQNRVAAFYYARAAAAVPYPPEVRSAASWGLCHM